MLTQLFISTNYSEWWVVGFHNGIIRKDIMTGTIIVIAMNLCEVSVFEVRHKKVQEVENFDNGLVRKLVLWNALNKAVFGAHGFPPYK
jgi:hypothetical protein